MTAATTATDDTDTRERLMPVSVHRRAISNVTTEMHNSPCRNAQLAVPKCTTRCAGTHNSPRPTGQLAAQEHVSTSPTTSMRRGLPAERRAAQFATVEGADSR